jgi:hypothetical protein
LGVTRSTVERWRRWWLSTLVESPFWRIARGFFATPLEEEQLPGALLERFQGDAAAKLIGLLKLLSPLSCTAPDG